MNRTVIRNDKGKVIVAGAPVSIYAPNVFGSDTLARTLTTNNDNRVDLIFDKADPMLNVGIRTYADRGKVGVAIPDITLGDPQHYHTNIFGVDANPNVNVGIRTAEERAHKRLTLEDITLGDPQHYHTVLTETPASKTAAINVNNRKVRGGFFSPALSGDLPLRSKSVLRIYAPS